MSLDIVEGDILVVGDKEYPIKALAEWDWPRRRSAAFARFATVTASTKRNPAVSGGLRGEPVTQIASLTCMPIDPAKPEIAFRMGLKNPYELVETYIDDGERFLHLILEDNK